MSKFLVKGIGRAERVTSFKCLEDIIKENDLKKCAMEELIHKTERAYGITKNISNKKYIYKNVKIRYQ